MQKFLSATIDQPNVTSLSPGDEFNLTESSGISAIKRGPVTGDAGVFGQIFAPDLPSLTVAVEQKTDQPVGPPISQCFIAPQFVNVINGLVFFGASLFESPATLRAKIVVLIEGAIPQFESTICVFDTPTSFIQDEILPLLHHVGVSEVKVVEDTSKGAVVRITFDTPFVDSTAYLADGQMIDMNGDVWDVDDYRSQTNIGGLIRLKTANYVEVFLPSLSVQRTITVTAQGLV